jgi:hypothetical protein
MGKVFNIETSAKLDWFCNARDREEWADHGEVPGEWDKFDRIMKGDFSEPKEG